MSQDIAALNRTIAGLKDKLKVSDDLNAEYLKLIKTAKADGIRDAVEAIEYDYCDSTHNFAGELLQYADKLGANNGIDG